MFANIAAALGAVSAGWSNVVQFTTFFVRREDEGQDEQGLHLRNMELLVDCPRPHVL